MRLSLLPLFLLLGACCSGLTPSRPARAVEIARLFPDDTELVIVANVESLRGARQLRQVAGERTLVMHLAELAKASSELKELQQEPGMAEAIGFTDSLVQSTRTATYAGWLLGPTRIVLEGKYDVDALLKQIQRWKTASGEEFLTETRGTLRLVYGIEGFFLAIVDDRTLVLDGEGLVLFPTESFEDRRKRRVDVLVSRLAGESQSKPSEPMKRALKSAKFSPDSVVRVARSLEALEDEPAAIQHAELFMDPDKLRWLSTFLLADEAQARTFQQLRTAELKEMSGQLSQNFGELPVRAALNTAVVRQEGERVTMELSATLQDLSDSLKTFLKMIEALEQESPPEPLPQELPR